MNTLSLRAHKSNFATIKNQSGQIAVEYILLLLVVVAVFKLVSTQLQGRQILASFVSKPWASLAGVIENGVPGPAEKTRDLHPNTLNRHVSLRGERR